jgi:hypothetical protein
MDNANTQLVEEVKVGVFSHALLPGRIPGVESVTMRKLLLQQERRASSGAQKRAQVEAERMGVVVVVDELVEEIVGITQLVVRRWNGTRLFGRAQDLGECFVRDSSRSRGISWTIGHCEPKWKGGKPGALGSAGSSPFHL